METGLTRAWGRRKPRVSPVEGQAYSMSSAYLESICKSNSFAWVLCKSHKVSLAAEELTTRISMYARESTVLVKGQLSI
jgi:hypothetical protein